MAAISAFGVTQHSQIFFHFSSEIEFNALRFTNYTIPRLCSTYAVATIVEKVIHILCLVYKQASDVHLLGRNQ